MRGEKDSMKDRERHGRKEGHGLGRSKGLKSGPRTFSLARKDQTSLTAVWSWPDLHTYLQDLDSGSQGLARIWHLLVARYRTRGS